MKKKKLLLFVLALMLLPLTVGAQARTGGQRTENYPALVDGHLAFLGISMNETPKSMRSKLIAKGYKIDNSNDITTLISLKGSFHGMLSRINIFIISGKISSIGVINKNDLRLPQAKAQFASLVSQLLPIYGKGEYESNEEIYKRYAIQTPQGLVTIMMHNSDELEDSSDFYNVVVSYDLDY